MSLHLLSTARHSPPSATVSARIANRNLLPKFGVERVLQIGRAESECAFCLRFNSSGDIIAASDGKPMHVE